MITNLLVLNSSFVGSHDLWWAEFEDAKKGYNVYRAYDHPSNWVKLNRNGPWLGHFYRDMTSLEQTTYTLQPQDFIETGQLGKWAFRIPDIPYATVDAGRAKVSNNPDDVSVLVSASGNPAIDGQVFRPAQVSGLDRTIFMQMELTLAEGGAVSNTAMVDTGNVNYTNYAGIALWQATYNKLMNYVDIYTSLNRTYYAVVPVGDKGELHAPGAPGTVVKNTQEVDQIDWVYEEMVRRNQYLFETTGEPAYIMFRKWRGTPCGCVYGTEQPKTGCKSCYETGFVGGYIGPYDFLFVPPDSALTREITEGGIKTTRDSRSLLTRTPIVQNGDLIIRRNGDRMVISNVVYKMPRGIILQQDFTVSLLPPGDTRYLIPEVNTGLPTIRNPVVHHDGLDGKGGDEPVFDARTVPAKNFENQNVQVGRTIEFGKIQS